MRGNKKNLFGLNDMCLFLEENNPGMGEMLEVGSYMGESAAMFVLYFETVHCVDPWDPVLMEQTVAEGIPAARVEEIFDRVAQRLQPKVIKHKTTSLSYSRRVPDESLDFVYIDGDHRADAVRKDIRAWLPKVKPGHYIGGHDYGNPNASEVADVVDELLGTPEKVFIDHSWLVRKEIKPDEAA